MVDGHLALGRLPKQPQDAVLHQVNTLPGAIVPFQDLVRGDRGGGEQGAKALEQPVFAAGALVLGVDTEHAAEATQQGPVVIADGQTLDGFFQLVQQAGW